MTVFIKNVLRFRALVRSLLVSIPLAIAPACGGDSSGPSEPTLLVFKAGEQQSGQVGTVLPLKVVIEARNSRGPVADVTIAVGVESSGSGSVTPASAKTGTDGTAQFTWTLGSKIGAQTLTAATTGSSPIHSSTTANAAAGPPTIVLASTAVLQHVVVGHAVSTLPAVTVTDRFGNLLAGASVTFELLQPGSVVSGTAGTTDAAGSATLGGWTIGPDALTYSIEARIANGAVALFEAIGIPASLTAFAGAGQTANAGTSVPILPAVRALRDDGTPLPNVAVTFTVTSGGGSVIGGTTVTAADGTARPIRWVLGTTPGLNRLEASTPGRAPVSFDAIGTAGLPAQVVASAGTSLSGFFGNYLIGAPEVTVTDGVGNPVAGIPVDFQVAQGGGQLTGVAAQTDFLGRAAATSWRLGNAGTQVVTATAGALPPVSFTATGSAPPPSTFKIEVRYVAGTNPTTSQRAAFDAASARWTQLIIAGAPPYTVVPTDIDPSGDCPSMLNEVVDGIVIHVKFENLNNANILGATGLCVIRDNGFLPVQGLMFLNTGALAVAETNGWLPDIILHEMGHALGYGTLWEVTIPDHPELGANHFRDGVPGTNPTYNGAAARAAFYGSIAPGTSFTGTAVPLEATGGAGTAYVHWRESTFKTEIMTGTISLPGVANPLSAMSVQQFRDLGYVVNDAPTDTYTFQALIQAAGTPVGIQFSETQLKGPVVVINRNGRVIGRVPRPFR